MKIYDKIKNTVYHGYHDQSFGDSVVTVKREEITQKLGLRLDLGNHSPTGFAWGYGGSGPHQLALAILSDFFGDIAAKEYYNMFTWDVIARLKQSPHQFDIYGHEIISWAGTHHVPYTSYLGKKYGVDVLTK